jgi:CheY-like chemotaxis protein
MHTVAEGKKKTIYCFLVDDDKDDQEIFLMALQDIDHPITCFFADDGVEAITRFNSDPSFLPDYIFIDINMPRMNGMECLEAVKTSNAIKHIPVYMISTSADPAIIARSKAMGAVDFIVKPSSVDLLTSLLAQHFNKTTLKW